MLVKIRNQYSHEAKLYIEKFSMSMYSDEFDVYLYVGEYGIDAEDIKVLANIGFRPSSWNKRAMTIETSKISSFTCID